VNPKVVGQVPLPDYDDVAAALARAGLAQTPAEAHGLAVGLAVAGVGDAAAAWQRELCADLDPNDVLASECRRMLDRIYAAVQDPPAGALHAPLLPAGIGVGGHRLGAVRDWCQGFLYGFGLGGQGVDRGLGDTAAEWLRDIAEISRVDTDDAEDSDENRAALIEVEEYLRVGLSLLQDDMQTRKADDEPK
jgi:uncharacterized protein